MYFLKFVYRGEVGGKSMSFKIHHNTNVHNFELICIQLGQCVQQIHPRYLQVKQLVFGDIILNFM